MSLLTTACGKVVNSDYFNPCEETKQVNIRVIGESLTTVASIFGNKAETIQMRCDGIYCSCFTRLVAIIPESGAIRVVLEKE